MGVNRIDIVGVCSTTFSRNALLRAELCNRYQNVYFNEGGVKLRDEALVKFVSGATKLIVGLERVDADLLQRLPNLKAISKYGVGLDNIDTVALKAFGVSLGWTPGVNRRSVSELALSLILACLRHLPPTYTNLRAGKWVQLEGQLLTGKTVGIIGLGHIGKDLVRLLKPFDCEIMAYDVLTDENFKDTYKVEYVDLEKLAIDSDIISVHLPLTIQTKNIIGTSTLRKMKRDCILVNTARGGIVDESALVSFLKESEARYAAFDVYSNEPKINEGLVELPNFVGTTHIGGSTKESILAMGRAAIMGLEHFTDLV